MIQYIVTSFRTRIKVTQKVAMVSSGSNSSGSNSSSSSSSSSSNSYDMYVYPSSIK